jgi:hypothetical protein
VNTRLPGSARLLVRLYALALRLYPPEVRREYGDEMQAVFGLRVAQAVQERAAGSTVFMKTAERNAGPGRAGTLTVLWRLFALACREARDLPLAIAAAHFYAMRGRMNPSFPTTSDQTPWPTALLSLLPFLITGTLGIILGYQPGWQPQQLQQVSQPFFWFQLVSALAVAAGLVAGMVKKFPRWAYPYPFYLAFALNILLMSAAYMFGWGYNWHNTFLPFLAVLLVVLTLPGLRSFYSNIAKDWTLLSYGLYGLVLFILAGVDKDESPRLTLLVLLPSLITLASALAHLRIRSAVLRIAVLLAGTFAGLFFWPLSPCPFPAASLTEAPGEVHLQFRGFWRVQRQGGRVAAPGFWSFSPPPGRR